MFEKFLHMKQYNQLFFTVVVAFAIIAFWRGAWGLLDIYLLPNDAALSMWLSLIVGLAILFATHYTTKLA